MISNLPLLFAEGYPTCIENLTLKQIERFVPFMLQCALVQDSWCEVTSQPIWWPQEVPYPFSVRKPLGMGDTQWLEVLKNLIRKCYSHYDCEFVLKFCTELSEYPISTFQFIDSGSGTTALLNKNSQQHLVTFRNENREYDKEFWKNWRTLLPKTSQNSDWSLKQVESIDIYLCESCGAEFESLSAVQKHEKDCAKQNQIQGPSIAEMEGPPEQRTKESFLNYFGLKDSNEPDCCEAKQNLNKKQARCPLSIALNKGDSVPFSSLLGIALRRNSELTAIKCQLLADRVERYCATKSTSRFREGNNELGANSAVKWPVTYKLPQSNNVEQDGWTHYYCFEKDRIDRVAKRNSGGINRRGRRLLSKCRDFSIKLTKLSDSDIVLLNSHLKSKSLTYAESKSHIFPTCMKSERRDSCTVNSESNYCSEVMTSRQSMNLPSDRPVQVIDLCSTDDEEEEFEKLTSLNNVPSSMDELNGGHRLIDIEGSHKMYFEKNAGFSFVEGSSYAPSAHMENSSLVEYIPSPSFPRSLQMNMCYNSPPSPSPAPAFEHSGGSFVYVNSQMYNPMNLEMAELQGAGPNDLNVGSYMYKLQ